MSEKYKKTIKITLYADSKEQLDSYLAAASARYNLTNFFSALLWAYNYGLLSNNTVDNMVKLWNNSEVKNIKPVNISDIVINYEDVDEIMHQQNNSSLSDEEAEDVFKELFGNDIL